MHDSIFRFDSVAEFGRAFVASGATMRAASDWTSGEGQADALRYCRDGNAQHVPAAQALLDSIDGQLSLDRAVWQPSAAGAYPIVPEAIMGMPEPMRRRTVETDTSTPVRMWVCLTSSATVPTDVLVRRATAALALAMTLAAERPLELWTLNFGARRSSDVVAAVRLNTAPLNLSEACYALTSQGFCRGLGYAFMRQHGFNGKWPQEFHNSESGYLDRLRRRLGGGPADVMLAPYNTARDAIMGSDPVRWINETIATVRATLDSDG